MPRHTPFRARVAALAIAVFSVVAAAAPMNVLLIIVDDYGWADVGVNNPETFYETPRLDAFAASGANLARGYAGAPVCSPTRVSIMSGVNPVLDGATEWFWDRPARSMRYWSADRINFLPLHRTTIAEVLRDEGYQTLWVGKWHLGGSDRHLPQSRGFDKNVAGGAFGNPGWKTGFFAPYAEWMNLEAPEGEHLPVRLTDETIGWLRDRDQTRPFFATLSYYSVHTPLDGRPDLVQKYEARRDALGLTDEERFGREEQIWPGQPARRVRVAQDHAVYAAMVEAMDEQIGRLLDAVDEMGLADDTLVMFVSDNGGLSTAEGAPTANTPLRAGKGWLYEGGIRVPFMVRWPGVTTPGQVVESAMHTSDIFPTILDAVGADTDQPRLAELEGRSMRADLTGTGTTRPLFFHYPHYGNQGGYPGAAVLLDRFKYVLRYEDGQSALYDIESDPSEVDNIVEANPALAESMHALLVDWLGEHGARFLGPRTPDDLPWRP
ncbi:MAG: sulfatase [Planctomycetota bacterium]